MSTRRVSVALFLRKNRVQTRALRLQADPPRQDGPSRFIDLDLNHHRLKLNMTISDDGNIITLEIEGASTQIYFYGAHVTSWKAAGEKTGGGAVERFFMSKKAVLDGSAPIRGGIPIAFPIFATDVHPDYPELGGAHGFARINRWTITNKAETADSVGITLTLEPNEQIKALFPPSFKLDYIVTLTKHALDTELKIANTSSESFKFNTALHTYYLVPSAPQSLFEGLSPHTYTNRLNLSSPTDLTSANALSLAIETARCYHLPSDLYADHDEGDSVVLSSVLSYDKAKPVHAGGGGVDIQLSGGWRDSVFWNPGQKTGDKIGDMGEGDWERFVCWEPGVIQDLLELKAGGEWKGTQRCVAI